MPGQGGGNSRYAGSLLPCVPRRCRVAAGVAGGVAPLLPQRLPHQVGPLAHHQGGVGITHQVTGSNGGGGGSERSGGGSRGRRRRARPATTAQRLRQRGAGGGGRAVSLAGELDHYAARQRAQRRRRRRRRGARRALPLRLALGAQPGRGRGGGAGPRWRPGADLGARPLPGEAGERDALPAVRGGCVWGGVGWAGQRSQAGRALGAGLCAVCSRMALGHALRPGVAALSFLRRRPMPDLCFTVSAPTQRLRCASPNLPPRCSHEPGGGLLRPLPGD